MSKRHQASRRRTYGRRQHEIHETQERDGRRHGLSTWFDRRAATDTNDHWGVESIAGEPGNLTFLRGGN